MSFDISDLLEKVRKRDSKSEKDDDSESEGGSDDDDEEEKTDIHVKGIGCDVWSHSILCYFNVFEVLKFFHVSKGFYVIACYSLQNRRAKSNNVLDLVMEKEPAENFLFKLVRWNCFDPVLYIHIFRNCIRKGYFEIVKHLHLKQGCHIKEWTLDIFEMMCVHLKNEEDNEEMLEGYIRLLEEFKEDVNWSELQSPEGFNVICTNKEMHEYVQSKFVGGEEEYYESEVFGEILEVSCEMEYMNAMEHFSKNNMIEEKQIKDNSIFDSYLTVFKKDRSKSKNRSRLLEILIPHLNLSSTEFLNFLHQSIEDTKRYKDLRLLLTSRSEDFRNLSLNNSIRRKPIFTDYCKYLERILEDENHREEEEEEGEENEKVPKKQNKNSKILWYGILHRVSSLKFLDKDSFECTHFPGLEDKITKFVDTILQTFGDYLDPCFDQMVVLKNACRAGNLLLVKYLRKKPRRLKLSPYVFKKEDVFVMSHFGLEKREDLPNVTQHFQPVIDNYFRIMKIIIRHNKRLRKRIKKDGGKKVINVIRIIDLTMNGTNEAYKSLYFWSDCLDEKDGNRLKRMMKIMEKDKDVKILLKKEKHEYQKKRPPLNVAEILQQQMSLITDDADDVWDDDDDDWDDTDDEDDW